MMVINNTLQQKANDLLNSCRVYIKVCAGKLRIEYPNIFADTNTMDRFEFFGTVVMALCVCVNLSREVEEKVRTSLESIVQDALEQWYFESTYVYEDALNYIKNRMLLENDIKRRSLLFYELASFWTIKNTLNEHKDPPGNCDGCIHNLSELLATAATGYWKID